MESFRKVAFTIMITFFAGSVVSVAARDLRASLVQQGDKHKEQVRSLIGQLQGETLISKGEGYIDHQVMPPRKTGALLTERDRRSFKSMLRKFLGAGDESSTSNDEQQEPPTQ